MITRLYYEDNGLWSIDSGPGSAKHTVGSVTVGGSVIAHTETNVDADNKVEPRAWLEFEDAKVAVRGNAAIIY